jgi:hypothetical protein
MRVLLAFGLVVLVMLGATGCIQQIYSDTASEQILQSPAPDR